jgi:hypothetical protein
VGAAFAYRLTTVADFVAANVATSWMPDSYTTWALTWSSPGTRRHRVERAADELRLRRQTRTGRRAYDFGRQVDVDPHRVERVPQGRKSESPRLRCRVLTGQLTGVVVEHILRVDHGPYGAGQQGTQLGSLVPPCGIGCTDIVRT